MKSSEFYKTTAWKWFSKYILLFYSKYGACYCASCGAMKQCNDKKMHVGHLIKVFETGANTNFATAFDERNVMPQCYQCNVILGGNELKLMDAINNKFGATTYNSLRDKSRFPFKLCRVELKYLSDIYREKFNKLVEKKGNPWK